ncbi:glucooligosaccharide oxidase [Mycena floridula]|nr:glucooligosaccharide oxidase [Mycena floridula]
MKPLFLFSLLFAALVSASDIKSALQKAGIKAFAPGDLEYTSVIQPFNLRYHYKPAAIAFPTNAAQVSAAVVAGASFNLSISARSGGHSYIANSLGDGRLVVDLSLMKNITIIQNKFSTNAFVEPGIRLGDMALALNQRGRALPHGTCQYVGLGGHAGHGGFGFASRMWGLTLDTILQVDVVLANGTLITEASLTNYPDLFWAMIGTSSSFGIVTRIVFQTLPAPAYAIAFDYQWRLDSATAANSLGTYQRFVKTDIPKELGLEITLTRGKAAGFVNFALGGSWYGDKEGFPSVLKPFLDTMPSPNSKSFSGNGSWIDNVAVLNGGPLGTSQHADGNDNFYVKSLMTPQAAPMTNYSRTQFMKYLTNEAYKTPVEWFIQLGLYGGANSEINSVLSDYSSFVHRDSMFTIQFYAYKKPVFPDAGFTLVDGMVNSITAHMPADWNYGAYLNYIDDRLPDWQKRYYGTNYPRLQSLKKTYDPTNVFRFPTSVHVKS